MGNPTLPTLDTIMKATIVEPGDIATVSFVSSALIILQDDGDFGDESVLNSIAAQDDQTRPTIPSLPSIPFPVRGKSNFRLMLGRYYSGRYDILSGLQIHKFSETRSIEWDPQGQQRLVAHHVLNDIYVTPPGCEKGLHNLLPSILPIHRRFSSYSKSRMHCRNDTHESEGMISDTQGVTGCVKELGVTHWLCRAADVRFLHWCGSDLAVLR